MITRFGNKLAEDLLNGNTTRYTQAFPPELYRAAQRRLQYLNAAKNLTDLKVPPGNRLEALKGAWKGYHAIRINDQWRVVFHWTGGDSDDVRVIDYH